MFRSEVEAEVACGIYNAEAFSVGDDDQCAKVEPWVTWHAEYCRCK
jgi:hypothetical protein